MDARVTMSNKSEAAGKFIPAKEIADLESVKGRTFLFERHKQTTAVKLVKVGRRDVQLEHAGEQRADAFSISQAEFRKFYKMAP